MRWDSDGTALPVPQGPPVRCPFEIVIDTREQQPYTFEGLISDGTGAARGRSFEVVTRRLALPVGDYGIFGYPRIVVERKSKADFLASLVRRKNFVGRLEKLADPSAYDFSLILVEAELSQIARDPGRSRYPFKSAVRTVIAWEQRYPTRWRFVPNRRTAEKWCFRVLERYWIENSKRAGGKQ